MQMGMLSKRDLFSLVGLLLPRGYDFRNPLPEALPWAERVPREFRSIRFDLMDGRTFSITQPEAYDALRKADEIVLLRLPGVVEDADAWRRKFTAWWRDLE